MNKNVREKIVYKQNKHSAHNCVNMDKSQRSVWKTITCGLIMEEQQTSQNTTENEEQATQETEIEQTQESG